MEQRKVTSRESTIVVLVTETGSALDLRQIQPNSLHLDSAKCNLNDNTKAALVRACYKSVVQQVKIVPLLDGNIPDDGTDWSRRAIAQGIPIPDGLD